jgi:hypothetical protein
MASKNRLVIVLGAAALVSLACTCPFLGSLSQIAGGAAQLAGNAGMTNASQLWPDVPRMDGMDSSSVDMPVYIKLYIQTALKAMSQGEGNVDWIAFSTKKTPDDVQAFYTSERMAAAGWDPTEAQPCYNGSEQGVDQVGALCGFAKQSGSDQELLAILATSDTTTNTTTVFFLRLQAIVTPTP